MRILAGIDLPFSPKSGGSIIVANDLYSELQKSHDVLFLALKSSSLETWHRVKNIVFLDVKKTNDPVKFMDYVQLLENKVELILRTFNPDIVHIHHLNFGLSFVLSKLCVSIPKIGFCHGTDILFARQNIFFGGIFEEIERNLHHIIFPSQSIIDDFMLISKNKKIVTHLIYWGIPKIENKGLLKKNNLNCKFELLYIGRSAKEKGLDILLNATEYLNDTFKVTIVTDSVGKEIQIISDKSLEIILKPYRKRFYIWKLFNKADLLIIPSTLEAFCLIAAEAQAAGLAILYSDIPCLTEIVGSSGLSFKVNNAFDLAEKIFHLKNHPQLLVEYRTNGITNSSKYNIGEFCSKIDMLSTQIFHEH